MPQSSVITAMVAAFPGMNADNSDSGDNYLSRVSGETTLQLPFGHAVMQGTNDDQCVSCTSQTPGQLLGIVAYSAANQIDTELGTVADSNGNLGIKPGMTVQIKYRGRLWVKTDEGVDPTSAVKIRTSSVSSVGPGSFRKTALATHTLDISKFARYCGTYASGFAMLDFDFRMSGSFTADS